MKGRNEVKGLRNLTTAKLRCGDHRYHIERSALCTTTHSTRGKKCDGVLTCTSAQPVECRCCCLLLQSFGLPRVDVWLQSSYSLYSTIRRQAMKLESEGGRGREDG